MARVGLRLNGRHIVLVGDPRKDGLPLKRVPFVRHLYDRYRPAEVTPVFRRTTEVVIHNEGELSARAVRRAQDLGLDLVTYAEVWRDSGV